VVMKAGLRGGGEVLSPLSFVSPRLNTLLPAPHLVLALELHLPAAAYGTAPRAPRRLPHMSLRSTLIALLMGIIGAYAAPMIWPDVASAGSCPNEEVRAEQGAGRLPDCRAFELVTPEIKADNGDFGRHGNFGVNPYGFPDGNHVYYYSTVPFPGAPSGGFGNALSTRTASGWVNTSLAPPATGPGEPLGLSNHPPNNGDYANQAAFTGDFSQAFVDSGFDTDPLDQDYTAPSLKNFKGTFDAYRLDLSGGAWSLAALPDTGPMTASFNYSDHQKAGTYIAGVSENGSHVFFQTFDQLPVAPGTPSEPHPTDMPYDRTGGHTYMVGVLPDGTISQTCNVGLGDGANDALFQGDLSYGAISPDGSNVVFTMASDGACLTPGVYLRENNATTVQLAGEGYVARSSDGSKVFTDGGGNVFEYDVATDVTSTITTEGNFVASSADGSRVYYLIGVGLNAGLYLWDNGTSVLIPTAGEGFANDLVSSTQQFGGNSTNDRDYAVATPDGSRLLFLDRASLTGYNNFGPTCTEAGTQPGLCTEAYVYDATSGAVVCVSCSPTGAPPRGGAGLMISSHDSLIPGYSEGLISPDGSRVFFETEDALVPQDTNGLEDVYEWENGRVYLISSGQGTAGSKLSGASSNGDDVFITTTDRLAPQDIESSTQIYDARVGGGFRYRPFTEGCDSGQCQGPQTPAPLFGAPASATFVGLGNSAPAASAPALKAKPKANAKKCKRGFVKKKHKCARKKKSKTAKRASGDPGAKSHA
jgi:hypothetical protein